MCVCVCVYIEQKHAIYECPKKLKVKGTPLHIQKSISHQDKDKYNDDNDNDGSDNDDNDNDNNNDNNNDKGRTSGKYQVFVSGTYI